MAKHISALPDVVCHGKLIFWRIMSFLKITVALLFCSFVANSSFAGQNYEVWVTNERGGDITIVSSTGELLATVPVGKRPRGIQISPDKKFVYVAVSGTPIGAPPKLDAQGNPVFDRDEEEEENADKEADGVVVLDTASRAVVRKLKVGSDPEQFALTADGKHLVVSNEDVGAASLVNLETGKVEKMVSLSKEPEGVAVSPDGKWFWITCETEGDVFRVSAADFKKAKKITVGGRPRSVAFLPDGSRAFVPSESRGKIHVVDAAKFEVVSVMDLPRGARPMTLLIPPEGNTLYASTGRAGAVAAIDLSNNHVEMIQAGKRPWGIALAPDGSRLFAANGPSNDISVIDTKQKKEVARWKAGQSPWGVVIVAK